MAELGSLRNVGSGAFSSTLCLAQAPWQKWCWQKGPKANRSSHPLLSTTDDITAGMGDILLLLTRLLVAAVFLMTVWTGGPNAAYLKSINFIVPDVMSPFAHVVEWIIVDTLVLERRDALRRIAGASSSPC